MQQIYMEGVWPPPSWSLQERREGEALQLPPLAGCRRATGRCPRHDEAIATSATIICLYRYAAIWTQLVRITWSFLEWNLGFRNICIICFWSSSFLLACCSLRLIGYIDEGFEEGLLTKFEDLIKLVIMWRRYLEISNTMFNNSNVYLNKNGNHELKMVRKTN